MHKTIEALGAGIRIEELMLAREKSWKAAEDIANFIEVGITEKEAISQANKYFSSQGVKKFWHRTHIRFGKNTIYSFNDPYLDDGYTLQADDIFYLDLGPIWDGIEGDVGRTYVKGQDPLKNQCSEASKIIFDKVREHWKSTNSTGDALCKFAHDAAKAMGWIFSPEYVKGHRLSEFPHSFYFKETLADIKFKPAPNVWVLEIQIRHPEKPIGAFYEDLLF